MKSMKRLLIASFFVVAMVVSMFTFASCKKEHEHNYAAEVVAPTCTENGYTKYTCECGDSYTDSETPAAHTFVQVAQKDPTCAEEGKEAHQACSVCGYVDGSPNALPKLAHSYVVTYKYPTVTEAGSRTSVCSVCNDTKVTTIDALSASLPNASDVLAKLIGAVATTVEVTEGSELVYVTEMEDGTGTKGAIFVEIAEAFISGKDETLKGHLKLKLGAAATELTGLVPADSVVVDKTNADYLEVYIYVNGDDVSIELNDENVKSVNMSEMLYGAIAEMLGMTDYENVYEIAYVMQSLADLAPLVEKALEVTADGLPTVSAEYGEHLAELFELIGDDIVKITTDAEGNTVYTVNPVALKALLEGLEDKTVAQYLESVYGEDVVGALVSFLKALPDKTVKEVVDAAVDFADGTGVAVSDIYTLIDIYVYFVSNETFSIEDQIAERYNLTLVELLAEINGIDEEEKADFVKSVKDSFAEAAEMLETASMDEMLSVLMGEEEGFLEAFESMIDMLDEAIALVITVDGDGSVVAICATIDDTEFEYAITEDGMTLHIYNTNGMDIEFVLSEIENGVSIVVLDNGEAYFTGSVTRTEVVNGDDTTVTFEMDLNDDENDLLDCTITSVNDEVTEANVVIRGYDYYMLESPDGSYVQTREFVTRVEVQYADDVLTITSDDTVVTITSIGDSIELVVTVDGEEVTSISLVSDEDSVVLTITTEDIAVTASVVVDETGVIAELKNNEDTLFKFVCGSNDEEGTVTISLEINGYETTYDKETDTETEEFVEYLNIGLEMIDNATGMDYVRLEAQESVVMVGYEFTDNGMKIIVTDEDGEVTYASCEVTTDDGAVTMDLFAGMSDETLLDAAVTFTYEDEDTLVIEIDLDRLLVGSNDAVSYIGFDGAVKVKVA